MDDRKTGLIFLGVAVGAVAVAGALVWYARAHAEEPIRTVKEAVEEAQEKIRQIEEQLSRRRAPAA